MLRVRLLGYKEEFFRRLRNRFDPLFHRFKLWTHRVYLNTGAKKTVIKMNGGYNASRKEYREKILPFWKKYGQKPKKYWFDMYCNGKDVYDPRYIPDSIWKCFILDYFNDTSVFDAYENKGLTDHFIKGVRQPDTVVKNLGGYYFDADDNIITQVEAVRLCASEEHLIIKPCMLKQGTGIRFYDRDDSGHINLAETFQQIGANFIVQRFVKQHPILAELNPTSVNTIRVISFHYRNEVHILSTLLRIGGEGARIDNFSAGGNALLIKPDGYLTERVFNMRTGWTDRTRSGKKFSDVHIPNFDGIIETCKKIHCELPYFDIIGWDFAIGEDEIPTMIEFNTNPGQNQLTGGPTFGDLTEEVLDDVFIKKTKKNAFMKNTNLE